MLSNKINIALSSNTAYGDVNLMPEQEATENHEMTLKSTDGRCLAGNEARLDSITDDISVIYETISCTSQLEPAAETPEDSDTNDTECATTDS